MIAIERGDLVHSSMLDITGVVQDVNVEEGVMTVHIGHGRHRFFAMGDRFVRPAWNEESQTYAWETLQILRDD